MSAAVVTPSRASIPVTRAVGAELVRAKGSAAARFALAGLAVSLLQGAGWLAVNPASTRGWTDLFGWQSLYATGLAAPVVALLASTVVSRESRAREGGTWARPLTAATSVTARGLVLAWQSLLLHLALTAPLLLFGLIGGLSGAPLGRIVTLWLVYTGTSLLPLVVAFAIARRFGMFVAVAVGLVWQVVGTLFAESGAGWAMPWSWGVRALMPVLEIHANAVRLEPGSSIRAWNPWWPTLASVVLAALLLAALAASATTGRVSGGRAGTRRLGGRVARDSGATNAHATTAADVSSLTGDVTRGRPRPLAAHLILWRGSVIWLLLAASLVFLVLVGAGWGPSAVTSVATWVVVPLGCCVLACLVWSAMAPGWRIAVLRSAPRSLAAVTFGVAWVILLLVVLGTFLIAAFSGGVSIGLPVMLLAVGTMTLAVDLWLATRFGAGAAVGVTLVVLVVSLVFGGTAISESNLWIVGVLGWPLTATTSARMLMVLLLCGIATVVAALGWLSALKRAARL